MNNIPAEFELVIEDKHLDELLSKPKEKINRNISSECLVAMAARERFPNKYIAVGFDCIIIDYNKQSAYYYVYTCVEKDKMLKLTNFTTDGFHDHEQLIRAELPMRLNFVFDKKS